MISAAATVSGNGRSPDGTADVSARSRPSARNDKDLIGCRLDRCRQSLRIGQRGQMSGIDLELNGFSDVGGRDASNAVTD